MSKHALSKRFRGFYPVVIDIETAGFDARRDAMLEIAAVPLTMDDQQQLVMQDTLHFHIEPFSGANLDPKALKFTGIRPFNPFRLALPEQEVLNTLFTDVQQQVKQHDCQRAVMVAHNAMFDQAFLQAAVKRCQLDNDPFHAFTSFDTASLCGLVYGQTVLARAMHAAGIQYDKSQAHSAKYDAEITAQLFCKMVNSWPLSHNN